MKKNESGILVASGGIDSTVLMYKLAKEKKLVEVMFCDYGQAARNRQRYLIRYHANNLGIPLFVQKINYPKFLLRKEIGKPGFVPKSSATLETMASLEGDDLFNFMKKEHVYLDGRNSLFMLFAALRASYYKVPFIYTGFQYDRDQWEKQNPRTFWGDVSIRFVEAMNSLFDISMIHDVKIVCPFLESKLDKSEIVGIGRKLGVNLDFTYSCDFYPACGKCVTCSQAERVGANQTPKHK